MTQRPVRVENLGTVPGLENDGCCHRCGAVLLMVDVSADGTPVFGTCGCPTASARAPSPRAHPTVGMDIGSSIGSIVDSALTFNPAPARRLDLPRIGVPGSPAAPARRRPVESQPASSHAVAPALRPRAVPTPAETRATVAVPGSVRCQRCGNERGVLDRTPNGRPVLAPCSCSVEKKSARDGEALPTIARRKRKTAPRPLLARRKQPAARESLVGRVALGIALTGALIGLVRHLEERTTGDSTDISSSRSVPVAATIGTMVADDAADRGASAAIAPSPSSMPARIANDGSGRLTRVEGPTAQSVLTALCEHPDFRGRLLPREIVPAAPPTPNARRGVVTRLDRLGTDFAIVIRRQSRTGRWSVEEGATPLDIDRLPAYVVRHAPVEGAQAIGVQPD